MTLDTRQSRLGTAAKRGKWRFQFGLKTLIAAPVMVGFLIMTDFLGLVGLRYRRGYENDPFHSPVRVVAAHGNTLELEDGRVLAFDECKRSVPLEKVIADSGNVVELRPIRLESDDAILVFIKGRAHHNCVVPLIPLIRFSLIPVDVPMHRLRLFDMAHLVHNGH